MCTTVRARFDNQTNQQTDHVYPELSTSYYELHSVWFYKKRWDFFITQALFSRFFNVLPFFLKLAQNLSNVSYKCVSYKLILSVEQ